MNNYTEIPKYQFGKIIKLVSKIKPKDVELTLKQFRNVLTGKSKAIKEWNTQVGQKVIRTKNGLPNQKYDWVRKAEREGNQAKRKVFSKNINEIPEEAKVWSKSKRSFTVDPQYNQILDYNRQSAFNKVKDAAIQNRTNQIMKSRAKKSTKGLAASILLYPAYNILSNNFIDNLYTYGYTDDGSGTTKGMIKKQLQQYLE